MFIFVQFILLLMLKLLYGNNLSAGMPLEKVYQPDKIKSAYV